MKSQSIAQIWRLETAQGTTVPSTSLSMLCTKVFSGASKTARFAAFQLLTLGALILVGLGLSQRMEFGLPTLFGPTISKRTLKCFSSFCLSNQNQSLSFGLGGITAS
jgi:hypothetical protein